MVCLSKYLSSELPEILLTNSQSDAYSRHTMFQVASRKRSDQRKAQPGSGVNNSSDEKNNRLTRPDTRLHPVVAGWRVDGAQKNMVCLSKYLSSELPEKLLQAGRLMLIGDIPCFRSPVASDTINEKRNPVPGLQFVRRKRQSGGWM